MKPALPQTLVKERPPYFWRYSAAIVLVLIAGGTLSAYTYLKSDSDQRNSLFADVNTISATIDEKRILNLAGSDLDLNNPDYLYLKNQLELLRGINREVRFIYLVGYRDGLPFFYVDSEPPGSRDYSPPGQVFSEAKPTFTRPFFTKEPIIEPVYGDRWGVWLTALSPVVDPDTGAVIAEVGMDVEASHRFMDLVVDASSPILLTLLAVLILLFGLVVRSNDRRIQQLNKEFTLVMIHELRSPLDNVIKVLSLLEQNILKPGTEEYKEMLGMVSQHTQRLLMLINDLLDIAKIEAGQFQINRQPCDIRGFVKDQVNFSKPAALDAKLTLGYVLDEKLPDIVSIDSFRIGQVMTNLVSNAIKYTLADGTVTVQALAHKKGRSLDEEAGKAGITWFVKDDRGLRSNPDSIVLAVTDSGVGIDEKDIPDLFKKFRQFISNAAKGTKQGTGLGLSIAKGITEAHNGHIGVATKKGIGSTFYVFLPLE
jgi:signal transduction histidine kinase